MVYIEELASEVSGAIAVSQQAIAAAATITAARDITLAAQSAVSSDAAAIADARNQTEAFETLADAHRMEATAARDAAQSAATAAAAGFDPIALASQDVDDVSEVITRDGDLLKATVFERPIGYDQKWWNVRFSRANDGRAHQNNTGRALMVSTYGAPLEVSDDNSTWIPMGFVLSGQTHCHSRTILPPGYYYRLNGFVSHWYELR